MSDLRLKIDPDLLGPVMVGVRRALRAWEGLSSAAGPSQKQQRQLDAMTEVLAALKQAKDALEANPNYWGRAVISPHSSIDKLSLL